MEKNEKNQDSFLGLDLQISSIKNGNEYTVLLSKKNSVNQQVNRFRKGKWIGIGQLDSKWNRACKLQRYQEFCKSVFYKDCGGGGDCMYFVIAEALNMLLSYYIERPIEMMDIRKCVATMVNSDSLKTLNLFGWEPSHRIAKGDVEATQKYILKPKTWGESSFLSILLLHHPLFKLWGIGFIVFTCLETVENKKKKQVIRSEIYKLPNTKHLICIINQDNHHWVLLSVALKSDLFASIFPIHAFPPALVQIVRNG